MSTETLLKILAIIIVASWACAGATRLLYPGVWKWISEKFTEIWLFFTSPCFHLFTYFWPRLSYENTGLKQHYILPIKTIDGDRESFTAKSFTDSDKKRKSEGSLKFERRKTQHNISIDPIATTTTIGSNNNNINNNNEHNSQLPPTPSSSTQNETRSRSLSKTKKEGRRRGPGWIGGGGRNPLGGRGNKSRGRAQQNSINGFDYEFGQPNYDFPPDTAAPARTRGPSEFDILNPLQPAGESSDLLDIEALEKGNGTLKYTRSMSAGSITNPRAPISRTTTYSNGNHPSGRKSDVTPLKSSNEPQLLDF